MRVLSIGLLFILLTAIIVSCEKDDICVDGDTPLLIIRFYDAADTSLVKPVSALRIVGIGNGSPVNTFNDRSTTDSVAIPLNVASLNTQFQFIINSAGSEGAESGNIDTLLFNYETREVFISRACGFVVNYDMLSEDLTTDSDNWIQGIEIATPNVTSQLNAHVKVFY